MNKKLINRIAILSFGVAFLGSCGDFIDNLVTTEFVNEGDTRACITYTGGKVNQRRYCDEQRTYPTQVRNFSANRFDSASYTPIASTELTGLWLVTSNIPPFGKVRETCDLTPTANANEFLLSCAAGLIGLTLLKNTNQINSSGGNSILSTTLANGDTIATEWNYSGIISGNNFIQGEATGHKTVNSGTPEAFTDIDFDMVKIAETDSQIGTFIAQKKTFASGAVTASINQHIYHFAEFKDFNLIAAYDNNGNGIVSILSSFITDNQLALKDYNAENKGLDFIDQETVLDVSGVINEATSWRKQKTRQLDFTNVGVHDIEINFLSNRLQSTRFERPDTTGNLTISF